ncbi:MAG: ribosome biogenesis GTPase Der [Gammaproteobacteria bacterium]|nr:ribosome biogenesis GTPase Der [Gammaproteobacteria bacterium]
MLPVIALVGRPNVGKSTLFNRLTRSRDALVADQPGLTRDRQYGVGKLGSRPYLVVDTGGISGGIEGVESLMVDQVQMAISEADQVLFLVDARHECSAADEAIAEELRRTGKPVKVVANKSENLDNLEAASAFYSLGLGDPVVISAAHGRGVKPMVEAIIESLPPEYDFHEEQEEQDDSVKIALVGRPNVGKSTMINRLLGEERVVAYDKPGTTRDSIAIPFEKDGKKYTLIDTAGVRRRSRVNDMVEKFSVIKTLQAIEEANVVLLVLDAREGISEQDATMAGHILDAGRALVVVINKWDGLESDERDKIREDMQRKLPFLDFATWRFVSALHGSGVGTLLAKADQAYRNAMRKLSTPELTRILEDCVMEHQPPMVKGRRIKLRYAHQGGKNPPLIVIHGNQADQTPTAYKRYLTNRFRKVFDFSGTPIRLEFRTGENPFEGRKNKLTARQVRKRQRLKKHVKRNK